MTRIILLSIISLSFGSFGQKSLPVGCGVIEIDQSRVSNVWFFSDTNNTSPDKVIKLLRKENGDYFVKNSSEVFKWFSPEAFLPDYYIFAMRVDTISGRWYRVVTNNERGEMYWTKSEASKKYFPWSTFLVNETTGIDINEDFTLDIKLQPNDSAKTIRKFDKRDCLEAIDCRGDWIKIRTHEMFDCNRHPQPIKSGWIRWKKDGRLTVNFSLTC